MATNKILLTKNCAGCNDPFSTRYKTTKFCSVSCSSKRLRKKTRVGVVCAICQKEIFLRPSQMKKSKSGLFFCTKEHKDRAQRLSSGFTQLYPSHYGNGNHVTYRKLALDTYGPKCVRCGYNKHIKVLEVDHIDNDRSNNDISNLQVLCCNCHTEKHLVDRGHYSYK